MINQTINSIKDAFKGEFVEVEVYKMAGSSNRIHTDNIQSYDKYTGEERAINYGLMDEGRYNETILANSCVTADFADWYGDKTAKVLVILIK